MKIHELFALDIEALLKYMRDCGISSLQHGSTAITLAPLPAVPPHVEPSHFEDEWVELPCGHPSWESNELGECLHGCIPPKAEDKN